MTSTLTAMPPVYGDETEMQPYRALSRSAVISVVLSLVGLLGYLFEPMLVVAAAGCIMGLIALQAIRRYPLEYSGRSAAIFGTVVSGTIFITGAAAHIYIYCTEVPEGYARIHFSELQPDLQNEPEKPIPSRALELSGKKIFVKGYTHKFIERAGKVDHFVLVPDLGECCFGTKATKPTHMIEVQIVNPQYRVSYSFRRLKLSGTFYAEEVPVDQLGLGGIHYFMEADIVQ
jgi:hypothetical protein